jgi:hypothetical protein
VNTKPIRLPIVCRSDVDAVYAVPVLQAAGETLHAGVLGIRDVGEQDR